jgi:hypothetical protein
MLPGRIHRCLGFENTVELAFALAGHRQEPFGVAGILIREYDASSTGHQNSIPLLEAHHDPDISFSGLTDGVDGADRSAVCFQGNNLARKSHPHTQDIVLEKHQAHGLAQFAGPITLAAEIGKVFTFGRNGHHLAQLVVQDIDGSVRVSFQIGDTSENDIFVFSSDTPRLLKGQGLDALRGAVGVYEAGNIGCRGNDHDGQANQKDDCDRKRFHLDPPTGYAARVIVRVGMRGTDCLDRFPKTLRRKNGFDLQSLEIQKSILSK